MMDIETSAKRLYCRKTKQPVTMRIDDKCPHCGQVGHGLDLSTLKATIGRLATPLPPPREVTHGS